MPEDVWSRSSAADAIYFLHIEKTAGSSVHRILTSSFPEASVCPTRLREELDGVNAATLRRYRLFSGHLTGGFTDFLGLPLKTITLLRDPVQRSISHYAHVRRDPSSEYHDLAQELSLRDFCLHPETRPLVEEYQARCLAGAALEAPLRQVVPDPLPRTRQDRDDLLRRARATLNACIAVGVTEQLSATLTMFADVLGLDWSGVTPYENASYNRPRAVDQETLGIIRELTVCDAILHQEAIALLREQIGNAARSPSRRVRSLDGGGSVVLPGTVGIGAGMAARLAWPERTHRFKLRLSAALCRAPRWLRVALASLYMGYRLVVDRRVSLGRRIPFLLGVVYLVGPIDFMSSQVRFVGGLDEVAALVGGGCLSVMLIGKRVVDDIRLAAMARFDLGPILAPRHSGKGVAVASIPADRS